MNQLKHCTVCVCVCVDARAQIDHLVSITM
jgi:hypothetical protein